MIVKNAELQWVAVVQPNQMSGKYSTDFYLNNKEDETVLITKIDNAWEEHKGSHKAAPQSLGYTETEEGRIKFKATQAPKSNDGKYTFTVGVYDSKAKKIASDAIPAIGNGTIANVDIELYPYTFKSNKGVKLNLNAIQILDLKEYGREPSFDSQDEGYQADKDNTFEDTTPVEVAGI